MAPTNLLYTLASLSAPHTHSHRPTTHFPLPLTPTELLRNHPPCLTSNGMQSFDVALHNVASLLLQQLLRFQPLPPAPTPQASLWLRTQSRPNESHPAPAYRHTHCVASYLEQLVQHGAL